MITLSTFIPLPREEDYIDVYRYLEHFTVDRSFLNLSQVVGGIEPNKSVQTFSYNQGRIQKILEGDAVLN